ncbi:NADAR family protein [Micromonospora sp. NPDC047730]|uniref:NADAR family protein n=1 Tax=Micromonospora sp. NPDC047730 TaxID=3364253 RepID=UPI003711D62E
MSRVERTVTEFRGAWACLSNFDLAPHVWEQIEYPTTEHSFQAGKTLDMGERLWIASAPDPGEAKRRGRSVRLRPHWDVDARFRVMEEVLRAKFGAHPDKAAVLVSTGNAVLVEGNTWHDNVWGDCHCGQRATCHEPGRNHLGRLLMELRTELVTGRAARPWPYRIV